MKMSRMLLRSGPLPKNLANFLEGCDLAGYNSNRFDIPLLVEEFLRAEIEFEIKRQETDDVQNIFHQMEQRTLIAAYNFIAIKQSRMPIVRKQI